MRPCCKILPQDWIWIWSSLFNHHKGNTRGKKRMSKHTKEMQSAKGSMGNSIRQMTWFLYQIICKKKKKNWKERGGGNRRRERKGKEKSPPKFIAIECQPTVLDKKRKSSYLLEIHSEIYTHEIIFEIVEISEIARNNLGLGEVRKTINWSLLKQWRSFYSSLYICIFYAIHNK